MRVPGTVPSHSHPTEGIISVLGLLFVYGDIYSRPSLIFDKVAVLLT